MGENSPSRRFFRSIIFVATVFAVATWIFLVDTNLFSHRERFHESDFIMTFYVAGRLVLAGRSNELYPEPNATSFINSPFDRAAHEFLPHLPEGSIGAYMYIPLVAAFFAPLSLAGPNYALLLWQLLSILALASSCWLLARITSAQANEIFFLASLYFPVFLTLWAGQLGLVFGLAPLCAGYFLLMRGWSIAAGLVWSLLLLKPQYFLAAAFVAIVLALKKHYRTFAAMSFGVIVLLVLSAILFSPQLTLRWAQSHQVSDSIFSAGLHGIPAHLITGLPANLMVLFPPELRGAVKWPLYSAAALLWVMGFAFVLKLARSKLEERWWISLSFLVGVVLCSLTQPHLLYYDLCVLLPAGVLLLARKAPWSEPVNVRHIALLAWITVSGFLPILIVFSTNTFLPFLLELVLLGLFVFLLTRIKQGACILPDSLTSPAVPAKG